MARQLPGPVSPARHSAVAVQAAGFRALTKRYSFTRPWKHQISIVRFGVRIEARKSCGCATQFSRLLFKFDGVGREFRGEKRLEGCIELPALIGNSPRSVRFRWPRSREAGWTKFACSPQTVADQTGERSSTNRIEFCARINRCGGQAGSGFCPRSAPGLRAGNRVVQASWLTQAQEQTHQGQTHEARWCTLLTRQGKLREGTANETKEPSPAWGNPTR